jgi:hypothetical protein
MHRSTREVDEIGLADRLRVRGVVGRVAIPDEDRLDLGPETGEVLGPGRRGPPERGLAGRRYCRREDRHPRPGAARRDEELDVDCLHRGQELARTHESDWTRHRAEE